MVSEKKNGNALESWFTLDPLSSSGVKVSAWFWLLVTHVTGYWLLVIHVLNLLPRAVGSCENPLVGNEDTGTVENLFGAP